MSLDQVNALLMTLEPVVEPVDEMHPMEYAELIGLADELFDEIYPYADELAYT